MPRGPQDVRRFLEQHQIPGRILEFPHPTRTVDEAARAVGTEPARILKTLLFLARGEPLLVLAGGTTRVDYRVLAHHLGLSRKKIRLARPEEVLAWTAYPVGAVPPIALPRAFPTLMDVTLLAYDEIYAGGGAPNALLCISPTLLQRITQARVLPLSALPKD